MADEPEKFKKIFKEKNSLSIFISVFALAISTTTAIFTTYWAFNLTEPYLIPRNPELRVWLKTGNIFSKQELGWNRSLDYIGICFVNEGRSITGHIHSNSRSGNIIIGDINIPNIEGGQGLCESAGIRHRDCYINDLECDYNAIIPSGKQTVNLKVECDYCVPNEFIKPIEICIWENSSNECLNMAS